MNGQNLRQWWRAREGHPLPELQMEALQWTIDEENRIGFTSAEQKKEVTGPLIKRWTELRAGR